MLIQKNEWHPGMRLPAVPELAQRFQVHRLTVLKALAGLKRTGWVQTVTGRGSFVADHLPEAPALRDPEIFPFQGSALRCGRTNWGPGWARPWAAAQNRPLVSFSANFPPADLLPGDALRRLHVQTMKELGADAWVYAAPAGHPSYLEAIARWLASEGEPIPRLGHARRARRPGGPGPGAWNPSPSPATGCWWRAPATWAPWPSSGPWAGKRCRCRWTATA